MDRKPLCAIIEKAYTKGRKHNGRPCHSPLVLFKVELLRTWYGLSDAEVESQVNDRLSFNRFVGIALDDVCPDSTSLCRFRKAMVAAAVYDDLLNELNRQLEQRGVLVKQGAIVDASITDSPVALAAGRSTLWWRIARRMTAWRQPSPLSFRRWFGAGFARYVGLAKTHGQHIMEAIAYNLYRTPGLIVSNVWDEGFLRGLKTSEGRLRAVFDARWLKNRRK